MLKQATGVICKVADQEPDVGAIRECLTYLVKETERADLDFCSLHLRIAIEELECAAGNIGPGANDFEVGLTAG